MIKLVISQIGSSRRRSDPETGEPEQLRLGPDEVFEPPSPDRARLFRDLVREYGRCKGRVYITTKERDGVPVGWVFVKSGGKEPDSWKTIETWVQVIEVEPEVRHTLEVTRKGFKRLAKGR